MKKHIWRWVLLLVAVVGSIMAEAQVVNEGELQTAITKGGTVTLGDDIKLSSTLEISNDVVLDLNGFKISITKDKEETRCILVKGGTITITGGGCISSETTGWQLFSNKNSFALYIQGGSVNIFNAIFESNANDGKSYTIYNNGKTLNDIIPYGAYINGANYNSSYIESSSLIV